MFTTINQSTGTRGAFVKLIRFESEDYAVVVREADDSRLHQRYIGPDLTKAEEVFAGEVVKLPQAKP
jgi:hypothetical protein